MPLGVFYFFFFLTDWMLSFPIFWQVRVLALTGADAASMLFWIKTWRFSSIASSLEFTSSLLFMRASTSSLSCFALLDFLATLLTETVGGTEDILIFLIRFMLRWEGYDGRLWAKSVPLYIYNHCKHFQKWHYCSLLWFDFWMYFNISIKCHLSPLECMLLLGYVWMVLG